MDTMIWYHTASHTNIHDVIVSGFDRSLLIILHGYYMR